MREITRSPIIPLDFEHQARAVKREFMIDYDRAEIWVVSPDDKNKLINLTSRIKEAVLEYVNSHQGDQITDITDTYVNVEGVGKVHVGDFLKFLAEHAIHGYPANGNGPMALTRVAYDNESIMILLNKVVVAGFPEAGDNYVPVKKNHTIQWVPISNLPTPDGYTPNKYDISDVLPVDGTITLTENPIQRSLALDGRIALKLPENLETNYCYLRWIVSTSESINTAIIFDSRITWRFITDTETKYGEVYIYEFETFDSGKTWYGKRNSYNNIFDGNSVVTNDELRFNYFTKQEILELFSWEAMDEESVYADNNNGDVDDQFIKGSALLGIYYYLDDITYTPERINSDSPIKLSTETDDTKSD